MLSLNLRKNIASGVTFALCVLTAAALFAQINPVDIAEQFPWREVGPANCGGRITDIEGVDNNPTTIYVGAATGGLWKTTNNGTTWEPIFDDQPCGSIGDIGLSQSNPNVLYVGTGEANNRNSSPYGMGVFKTTDGGETWTFAGLKETHHIGRIIVHPENPDIVYVAALGHLWGTNDERGVFKSTDGGKNWDKVLYFDERTGVTDLAMDPEDSNILYAAVHERLRDKFDAGDPVDQTGPNAGIYVTRDGGKNWERCITGLPTEEMGRIGIASARSNPGTVYALISTESSLSGSGRRRGEEEVEMNPNQGGVFKSTDYGKTWQHMNTYNNRPSYYSQIRVDPNNENVIWICTSPLAYSSDGGKTVVSGRQVQGRTHIDYHSCWINPNNSDHVLVGGDGGINITYDSGKSWEMITDIGLGQFYAIAVDMRKPYYLAGGLQDNGVWVGASRGRLTAGVTNDCWFPLSNADGFFCQIDPTDYNIIYAETQSGSIYRRDLRTGSTTSIRPGAPQPAEGEQRERYRFDWNSPMQLSPHNPRTLYFGGNILFKTVDQGNNWKAISPDLTANPDERSSAIVSVCESPLEAGVVWAGTNDGNVYLTKDDGVHWTLLNANITGAPQFYWVKRIEASHHAAGRAYVALDGHRYEDWAPYIYVTEDFGATWKNISNNLPEGSVYVVREDLKNPDLLFAGSEFALHYSLDRGMTWSRFMTGFPTVPVHDLVIHPRDGDLIAATHGRGAWIADNITPLQQLTADVKEEDVHLFDVRPEVQWERTYEWSWVPEKRFYKPNPPTGSTIAYYLKRDIPDSVTIEILDITGEVIWNFDGAPTAGISKVFWNFRKNPPPRTDTQPGQFGQQMRGRVGRSASPAEPGEYLVRLTAGGTVLTTKLIIEKDNPGYLGK